MRPDKLLLLTALSTLLIVVGCSSGGDTYTTVEPAPVVIVGEDEPSTTELFEGVRDAYSLKRDKLEVEVRMIDNKDIDIFNFVFVIEYEDEDVSYSEPNAERGSGAITVSDAILVKKKGRYTISLFYYGDDYVQVTKHNIEVR